MNENTEPVKDTKLRIVTKAMEEIVYKRIELYGTASNDNAEDYTADEWIAEYRKLLDNFYEAIENYVEVRAFIALKKYVAENNKAA